MVGLGETKIKFQETYEKNLGYIKMSEAVVISDIDGGVWRSDYDASLSVDIGSETEDIFLIKKGGETKLKINNDGVLVFSEFNPLDGNVPHPIEGGLIYIDNNFYFGI